MLSNISINTYLSINVFILRLFTNDLVAGYYSVAEEKYSLATRQVPVMFSQVIYPPFASCCKKGRCRRRPFSDRCMCLFYYWCLLAVYCCSAFSFYYFVVLGANSGNAVLLLRLFCLGPVIVCLHVPASQLLMAANHRKELPAVC